MSTVCATSSNTQAQATAPTNNVQNDGVDRNSPAYQNAVANAKIEIMRAGALEGVNQAYQAGKISYARYKELCNELNATYDKARIEGVPQDLEQTAAEDLAKDGPSATELQKMVQDAVLKDIVENGGLLSEETKAKLKKRTPQGANGGGGGAAGGGEAAGGGGGAQGAGGTHGAGEGGGTHGAEEGGGTHGAGEGEGAHGSEGVDNAQGAEGSRGASESHGSEEGCGSWLELLAKIFGKVLGDKAAKMTKLAQEIDGLNKRANQLDEARVALPNQGRDDKGNLTKEGQQAENDIQKNAREITAKTMELQGVTQQFNVMQTAFSTVVKGIGEAYSSILRKQ